MKGVIQIGAHYAEEYEGYVSQGIKDFVFFEPIKANFKKLEKILDGKPENILLYNLAIGNMDGMIKMYTETTHQGKSCSILKPHLHTKQYPDIIYDGIEMVRINKLDNIPYNRDLYDHLHMDLQGYELEALKGAEESLKYIKTATIEVYRAELFKDCPMIEDIVRYLMDRGFNLMEVFWRGNTWGDAKFTRL